MDATTYLDWGSRVRKRRGSLGQETLADLAGVDQSTISRLERGQIRPTDELKWKVAAALATTVDDLFPYPNVRPPFPQQEAV